MRHSIHLSAAEAKFALRKYLTGTRVPHDVLPDVHFMWLLDDDARPVGISVLITWEDAE